jgi:hypothetical protein
MTKIGPAAPQLSTPASAERATIALPVAAGGGPQVSPSEPVQIVPDPIASQLAFDRHRHDLNAQLLRAQAEAAVDDTPPTAVGISADSAFQYRLDEEGRAWIDLPEGRGSWFADDVARFLRDQGYAAFDDAEAELGPEGLIARFDHWSYHQWNGPQIRVAHQAGIDLGFRTDPSGVDWIVLPDGRGQWDLATAELGAHQLGFGSVGGMFAALGTDRAIESFDQWQAAHFDPGPAIDPRRVLDRAAVVAAEINRSGGYRFDGTNDCYGFVTRVVDPLLAQAGLAPMPRADGPRSPDWEPFTDWSQLRPGDVVATGQGHQWGNTWHGAIFAGIEDGVPMIWDASSTTGGAHKRPAPQGLFSHYYRPLHQALGGAAAPSGGAVASPEADALIARYGGDPSFPPRGMDRVVQEWAPDIQRIAAEHGVPWEIVAAMVGLESRGDPSAVSPSGAVGLMQIVPEIWRGSFGGAYDDFETDPIDNLHLGAAILRSHYDRYRRWDSAIAAYLGAVDGAGDPTTARDVHGTSGFDYLAVVANNISDLRGRFAGLYGG